jgi:DNA gyrase/topoisomerase IV subunit B
VRPTSQPQTTEARKYFFVKTGKKSSVDRYQYTDDYRENLYAFTNNIINPEGGTRQGFHGSNARFEHLCACQISERKDDNLVETTCARFDGRYFDPLSGTTI